MFTWTSLLLPISVDILGTLRRLVVVNSRCLLSFSTALAGVLPAIGDHLVAAIRAARHASCQLSMANSALLADLLKARDAEEEGIPTHHPQKAT